MISDTHIAILVCVYYVALIYPLRLGFAAIFMGCVNLATESGLLPAKVVDMRRREKNSYFYALFWPVSLFWIGWLFLLFIVSFSFARTEKDIEKEIERRLEAGLDEDGYLRPDHEKRGGQSDDD